MFKRPSECLGVGVNYRTEVAQQIIDNSRLIDFIEINTERFFSNQLDPSLNTIVGLLPVVLHGLTLSIGTLEQDISINYLHNLANVQRKIDFSWFSEHIAMTNVNGLEIRALMPVSFNEESISNIVKKAKAIQSVIQKPFLLENITYYYAMPNASMDELSFISAIIERADCGLLLDVNNLYVNAMNHGYDPYRFIDGLPLERVVEVHLAGCDEIHNLLIDTHASHIRKEVLLLFQYLCKKTAIKGVVIERDAKLNHFSDLIEEVTLVRQILKK